MYSRLFPFDFECAFVFIVVQSQTLGFLLGWLWRKWLCWDRLFQQINIVVVDSLFLLSAKPWVARLISCVKAVQLKHAHSFGTVHCPPFGSQRVYECFAAATIKSPGRRALDFYWVFLKKKESLICTILCRSSSYGTFSLVPSGCGRIMLSLWDSFYFSFWILQGQILALLKICNRATCLDLRKLEKKYELWFEIMILFNRRRRLRFLIKMVRGIASKLVSNEVASR